MCREIPGEENFRLLHSDVREPLCVWSKKRTQSLVQFRNIYVPSHTINDNANNYALCIMNCNCALCIMNYAL